MKESPYKVAQEIASLALEGMLALEDFFKIWPEDNSDDFLKIVFEDVEDAIEHIPGFLLTKEIDWNTWRTTDAYRNLLADIELLKFWNSATQKLIECRNLATQKEFISEIEIKEFVKHFMNQNVAD